MTTLVDRLTKSTGITASSAKLLRGAFHLKTVAHSLGSFRGENIPYRSIKNIAEGDISLAVQAARYNAAIAEYAEMVTETVAKDGLSHIFRLHIRPSEAITVFKVQFMPYSRTS